jgi:rhamnosyltransferase
MRRILPVGLQPVSPDKTTQVFVLRERAYYTRKLASKVEPFEIYRAMTSLPAVLPVCAVVVTYHPGAKILDNISRILAQVQGLVVVDNCSNVDELERLRVASRTLSFQLIENGENLGIAEALNEGVRWAKSRDYPWVLLLDQDSGITDGFVRQMFAAWESRLDRERVASIHPRYVDPQTRVEVVVPRASDGSPLFPMTSGALMPGWIFERIGWFASEYFIDLVDWEYCFRIRAAGYLVTDSSQAALLHTPGNPKTVTVMGHSFQSSHHSAIRRYYISRNCIAFYRKYFFSFPGLIMNSMYRQMHDTIVCLITEENRARKFRNFLLGTWDGLTGKMGKREGL